MSEMKSFPAKDPNAVLDYAHDYAAWLGTDVIVDHTITVAGPANDPAPLTVDSSAVDGTKVLWWLSGGSLTTYNVTVHIVTAAGREDDRTTPVPVEQR